MARPDAGGRGSCVEVAWQGTTRAERSSGSNIEREELESRAGARAWARIQCAGCRGWSDEVACARGWPEEGPNGAEKKGEESDREEKV